MFKEFILFRGLIFVIMLSSSDSEWLPENDSNEDDSDESDDCAVEPQCSKTITARNRKTEKKASKHSFDEYLTDSTDTEAPNQDKVLNFRNCQKSRKKRK